MFLLHAKDDGCTELEYVLSAEQLAIVKPAFELLGFTVTITPYQ